MKVLIFCDFQGQLGDSIRISRITNFLQTNSFETSICNLSSDHTPKTRLLQHPEVLLKYVFSQDGLRKELAYAKLAEKIASRKLNQIKPDVVLAEGIIQGGIIQRTCRKQKIPLVIDIHGLASTEYEENQFIKQSQKKVEYLKKLEGECFEGNSKLLVVSKPMKNYAIEHGASDKNIFTIPNGGDVQNNTASFSNPLKVVYGGILAFWEDIDAYLDLCKIGAYDYYLAGGGPLSSHVFKRIKNEKIKLKYQGTLQRTQALAFFSQMSVGIAPSVKTMTRQVASPIKVFDYLSCGLPVITPNVGEWAEVIKKFDCGIVTENSSSKEFYVALEQLQNQGIWEKKSKNAVHVIKTHYSWDKLLQPIKKALTESQE